MHLCAQSRFSLSFLCSSSSQSESKSHHDPGKPARHRSGQGAEEGRFGGKSYPHRSILRHDQDEDTLADLFFFFLLEIQEQHVRYPVPKGQGGCCCYHAREAEEGYVHAIPFHARRYVPGCPDTLTHCPLEQPMRNEPPKLLEQGKRSSQQPCFP